MILIIDNYDSFVYNLARYVVLAGSPAKVVRNNAMSADECLAMNPVGVILSPGPKIPETAGVSMELLKILPVTIPLLGVCLGHQCLVEHFGGVTQYAKKPLHGQASDIEHTGEALFHGLPTPLSVGRYHSLISCLSKGDVQPLRPIAWSAEREVMGVAHQKFPWFGVQFHPESVLTPSGQKMIKYFVDLCYREMERDSLS